MKAIKRNTGHTIYCAASYTSRHILDTSLKRIAVTFLTHTGHTMILHANMNKHRIDICMVFKKYTIRNMYILQVEAHGTGKSTCS